MRSGDGTIRSPANRAPQRIATVPKDALQSIMKRRSPLVGRGHHRQHAAAREQAAGLRQQLRAIDISENKVRQDEVELPRRQMLERLGGAAAHRRHRHAAGGPAQHRRRDIQSGHAHRQIQGRQSRQQRAVANAKVSYLQGVAAPVPAGLQGGGHCPILGGDNAVLGVVAARHRIMNSPAHGEPGAVPALASTGPTPPGRRPGSRDCASARFTIAWLTVRQAPGVKRRVIGIARQHVRKPQF